MRKSRRLNTGQIVLAALLSVAAIIIPGRVVCQSAGHQARQESLQEISPMEINRTRSTVLNLMNVKRYSDAIVLLEPVCEKYPERHDLTELLATCYLRAGRAGEARLLLDERIARVPERPGFIRILAAAYLDAGMREKALSLWESLLGENDINASNHILVSRMQWEAGMFGLAIETLERGTRFSEYFEPCGREKLRLERLLGRNGAAFMTGLRLARKLENPMKASNSILFSTFREAGMPDSLLSVVDSLSVENSVNWRFFRLTGVLLRVERGEFERAIDYISGGGGIDLRPDELYYFASVILRRKAAKEAEDYRRIYEVMLSTFMEKFGRSPVVPQMLLAAASFNLESGDLAEKPEKGREHYRQALAFADSVLRHPAGRSYRERATIIKAQVLVDRLYRPTEALESLKGIAPRGKQERARVDELMMKAWLASGRFDEADSWFDGLLSSPDSARVAMASFGQAMTFLYRQEWEKAAGAFSALAEKYVWSTWANDALEQAVTIKKSIISGTGPLAALVKAKRMKAEGKLEEAAVLAESVFESHPDSPAAPEAVWTGTDCLLLLGKTGEALDLLADAVSRAPLSGSAPRALEKTGSILEPSDPAAAASVYRRLIEDYPRYPFIARVRSSYLELAGENDGPAPEDDTDSGSLDRQDDDSQPEEME
ncbi:MAG: tetratricopeptide repeat protein [Bacteroidales bacterium]|nr:tetratricopeptide repeat protein [Candidatus Latescibacterota bacterium]